MAGDIQAELNSHTAGVSDIHAWGLIVILPPVHELVRLRTTRLLRLDTQISANSCTAAGS